MTKFQKGQKSWNYNLSKEEINSHYHNGRKGLFQKGYKQTEEEKQKRSYKQKDIERQKYIEKELGCQFLRFDVSKIEEGI